MRVQETGEPEISEWTSATGRTYAIYDQVFPGPADMPLTLEVGLDITEQRRAQLDLAKNEEQYRLLFENAGIGIGFYTAEGILIDYNRIAAAHMGGVPEQFVGKTIIELFGEERGSEYLQRIVDAARSPEAVTYDDFAELPTGPKWFLSTYSRVESPDGEVAGVQVLSEEITDRKAAEAALLESERRFRELTELLPEIVYECDVGGRITFANHIAFQRFSYSKEDLAGGLSALEMIAPEDRDRAAKNIGRIMGGEAIGGQEYTALSRDGSTFPAIIHSVPVVRDGELAGLRGVIVDITEQRRARDALLTADEIVAAIPTGILIYQVQAPEQLVLVSGNAAAAPFVDLEANAGAELARHWPPAMVERLRPALLEVARDGGVYDREVTIGSPIASHAFHMRAFGIPDDRVVVAFEDVSERRRAEQALRAEEEKYRQLFENMMNGFALHEIVLDEEGEPIDYVFLEVNSAFEQLTGLKREDLIGKRVSEALPGIEDDPSDWIGRYGRVAATGEEARFEQHSEAIGKWFSVLAFSPQQGRFATIFEDITERRRAEAAVAEWKNRYEGAVKASRHILYDWDSVSGEVTYGGDFERILGYTESEMSGGLAHWTSLIHPEDRLGFEAAIERLIEAREAAHLQYRVRRKDGEYIHIEDDGSFIHDSEGRAIRMLGFVKDVSEQRLAAERVQESEWRYRSIVELAPTGIVTIDLKGVVTSCNRAFEEMAGYEEQEMIGRHFSKLPPAKLSDVPQYIRMFRSILAGRPVAPFETTWSRKDGTIRAGEIRVATMTRDDKLWGIQVIVQDITDRKAAESELRASEIRYRSLFEDAVLGIYQTTPDGRILAANPALVRMLGYEAYEELAERNLEEEAYEPETPRARFKERLETLGSHFGRESAWKRRDGTTIYVRENARVVRGDDGEILYYEGTIEDITDRKAAEREAEALRAQLELTQYSVDSTDAVVLWVEPDGHFVFVNNAACRLLDYAREELLSLSVWEIDAEYPEDLRAAAWEELRRLGQETVESTFRKKGGELFPVEITAQHLEFQGRELEFAVAFDISERKRLEAQLRQSQKLESIGTLASGVAHEINNPLTGIINYAQLIADRVGDAKLKGYAEGIKDEGDRVARIVRNLLSFSRREPEHHSPARIVDIVDASLSLYASLLRRDQIELLVDVPGDLPLIDCRSQEIQQVVINLLTNARDSVNLRYPAAHDDKRIAIHAGVHTENGRGWLRLSVADRGGGIAAEIVDRIFDPFFTTKPRDEGTGLGLSVSYGLVRDHGGRMTFETEASGWTVFHMDLPMRGT